MVQRPVTHPRLNQEKKRSFGERLREGTVRKLVVIYFVSFIVLSSVPSANNPRRFNHPLSPGLPKESPGLTKLGFTRVPDLALPCFVSESLPDFFLFLFRLLARGIRRWPWMGAHEAEQEKMDCKGNTTARVAR
jgi:hypothetical protein